MAHILAILVMLAILSVLVIVHELGHFSVARFFGFQTPVFGFGLPFGPYWVAGNKWGTQFRIHACLLGGYVAIPELGDESAADDTNDAFGVLLKPMRKFPIWQRALVAFAGVFMNICFAYLVMLVMFLSMGQPLQPTMVYSLIKSNPIATEAGIKPGDQLLSIDSEKISGPDDAVFYLTHHPKALVNVAILRAGLPLTLNMVTNPEGKVGMALISKGPVAYEKVQGNFFQVAWLAGVRLFDLTRNMLEMLGQMFSNLLVFHKGEQGAPTLGIQDLHGILAVIKIGADIAQQDWSQLFLFTIMISLDLAIINLLPWPALDGGHLAFMALEAVRGKPMGERAQGEVVRWGFISLLLLMSVVMVNDVTALMQGKLNLKLKKAGAVHSNPTELEKKPTSLTAP